MRLAFFVFLAAAVSGLSAQKGPLGGGTPFLEKLADAKEAAKKDGKLVFVVITNKNCAPCQTMEAEVYPNPAVVKALNKYTVAVKNGGAFGRDPEISKTYKATRTPTVIIAEADGKELLRMNYVSAPELVFAIEGATTFKATIESLEKAKDSAAKLPLLKKIAGLPSERSRDILKEYAGSEANSEGLRKAAIEGLAKQPTGFKDAVGFLGHKTPALRTAAFNGLKAALPFSLDDLMEGLKGDTPEERENAFKLLSYGIAKNPKLQKDATFWKTAKEAERKTAAEAWKLWWDTNKPPELRYILEGG